MRVNRRWIAEAALPAYALAVVGFSLRPDYLPGPLAAEPGEALVPTVAWALTLGMGGVLALSGLVLAFFLLYSPVYLAALSARRVFAKGEWVDRTETRFYVTCFIVLCFLCGLLLLSPAVAASAFAVLAGFAHLLWRYLL